MLVKTPTCTWRDLLGIAGLGKVWQFYWWKIGHVYFWLVHRVTDHQMELWAPFICTDLTCEEPIHLL